MRGYIVILKCEEGIAKTKGRVFHLEPGYYAYVGSCGINCAKRVSRHMSKEKKKHWHIDYITDFCDVIAVLVLNLPEKEIARRMSKYPYIPGFGSTDDRQNPSHLFKIDITSFFNSINSLLR